MKRRTRKRLLQELDCAQRTSKRKPVSMFLIYFAEEYGATCVYDMERFLDKSEVMAKLMDLSLTHNIVGVDVQPYGLGICVMESKNGKSNIDDMVVGKLVECYGRVA